MARSHGNLGSRTWQEHRLRAFAIRAFVFLLPIVSAVAITIVVAPLLPSPSSIIGLILWWATVLVASTIGMLVVDRAARRLLPLATLLRLSMLFPDRAPSRLKIARRVSGSRAIERELERARLAGVTGDRQEAAETILALVGALGDYDSRTRGHSERTQLFVTMLADELGMSVEDRGRLVWAALVHDIGKLHVPHEVLNKPGQPTDDEWHVLRSHPVQGALICEPLRGWLGEWWHAIEQHHEKFDGSGYPRGLAGDEISYGARIVTVADSYEVMTAARAYKQPMTADAARKELIRCAGTHFDPDVVRAFVNISWGRNVAAGPLAWIAQLLMIRPGPILGRVLDGLASATAAGAGLIALGLVPAVANHVPATELADNGPAASRPAQPRDSSPPPAEPPPPRTPQHPAPVPVPVPTPTDPSPTTPAPTEPEPTVPTPTVPTPTVPTPTVPVPIALVDDTLSTVEDTAASIDVLANDQTGDGLQLSVVAVSVPSHGTTTITSGNWIRYVPTPGFSGSDSATYTARSSDGRTSTATIGITVSAVNHAPISVDDAVTLAEDAAPVTIDPVATDTDADHDVLSLSSVSSAGHGSVSVGVGNAVTYVPDQDYNGVDSFTYAVTDGRGGFASGTVGLTITPGNDPPVPGPGAYSATVAGLLTVDAANGVLSSAHDVDGDALTVVSDDSGTVGINPDGSFTYLPLLPGALTVNYVISDGTTTANGSMTITSTVLPAAVQPLYLHPTDTDVVGVLNPAAPTNAVGDYDFDGHPGLTIKSSDLKVTENDVRKFQLWSYAVPVGGYTLDGPVTMELTASTKDNANKDIDYAAWVFDCPPTGPCTLLTSAVDVRIDPWSTSTSWQQRHITVGSYSGTVPGGHTLQVRLAFHGSDMWFPLDAANPSILEVTS